MGEYRMMYFEQGILKREDLGEYESHFGGTLLLDDGGSSDDIPAAGASIPVKSTAWEQAEITKMVNSDTGEVYIPTPKYRDIADRSNIVDECSFYCHVTESNQVAGEFDKETSSFKVFGNHTLDAAKNPLQQLRSLTFILSRQGKELGRFDKAQKYFLPTQLTNKRSNYKWTVNVYSLNGTPISEIPYSSTTQQIKIAASATYDYVREWQDGYQDQSSVGASATISSVFLAAVGESVIQSSRYDGTYWYFDIPSQTSDKTLYISVADMYGAAPQIAPTINAKGENYTYEYYINYDSTIYYYALAIGGNREAVTELFFRRKVYRDGVYVRDEVGGSKSFYYTFDKNLSTQSKSHTESMTFAFGNKNFTEDITFRQDGATIESTVAAVVSFVVMYNGIALNIDSKIPYNNVTLNMSSVGGSSTTHWIDKAGNRDTSNGEGIVSYSTSVGTASGSIASIPKNAAGESERSITLSVLVDGIVADSLTIAQRQQIVSRYSYNIMFYYHIETTQVSYLGGSIRLNVNNVEYRVNRVYEDGTIISDDFRTLPEWMSNISCSGFDGASVLGSSGNYTIQIPENRGGGNYLVVLAATIDGQQLTEPIRISQSAMEFGIPVIQYIVVDDIPAGGGSVSGGTAYYTQEGVQGMPYMHISFNAVEAESLYETVTERYRVASRSVYIRANGQTSEPFGFDVYQAANERKYIEEVVSPATTIDDWKYGQPSVSIQYANISADGGESYPNVTASISVAKVYYNVSETIEYYYSYTSGYESEHRTSGGVIDDGHPIYYAGYPITEDEGFSFSFSGDCDKNGVVRVGKTSLTYVHPIANVYVSASKYGNTGYASITVYQEASEKTGAVYMSGGIKDGWYIVNTWDEPKQVVVHFTLTGGTQHQTGAILVSANSQYGPLGTGDWINASAEIV